MIRIVGKYDLDGYEIPLVQTELYGVLRAPRDFSQLATLLDEAVHGYSAPEGWRG